MALVSGQTKMRFQQQCLHQFYRTPDIPIIGTLTEGPRDHMSSPQLPLPLSLYVRSRPNPQTARRTIPLSPPAVLSLALQAFLSHLAAAPVWREGKAARSVQERGSEKSEAQRTAWRRRSGQLAAASQSSCPDTGSQRSGCAWMGRRGSPEGQHVYPSPENCRKP